MRLLLTLCTAGLLSACSQAETSAAAPNATAVEETTAVTSQNVESKTDTEVQPVTDVQAISEIPARFLGVWDYVGGTCAPESDMRLEITQEQLVFYESVGDIRSFQVDGDTLRLDLAMSGEGKSWRDLRQLTVQDNGTLHIVDGATPDAVDEYPRKKCDA